ncbi:MAG TPA: acetylglutamate kinase [Bryobacteraceae bacterium]|nr:acetylglutamate kinase [Bryobacteraceae bacterium]
MKILIKLGGTLLDSQESRLRLAREIGEVAQDEAGVVVVHGGGKQMTRFLAERGIESQFIHGLRVTTPDVLDAVLKVLGGTVNKELVAAFIAAGANAVGLTGMDALLAEAEPMGPELGAVGKPIPSSGRLLALLLEKGYLPVVACLAGDRQGRFYNVNADQMAVSVASSIQAEKIFFLTDVDGVKGKDGAILPEISLENCRTLIDSGTASGGMRAKLDAAAQAASSGVDEIFIAPGAAPHIISRLLQGQSAGTRLLARRGARSHA